MKGSNRYTVIKGLLYEKYISILTMYAPPNHPTDFITKVLLELELNLKLNAVL